MTQTSLLHWLDHRRQLCDMVVREICWLDSGQWVLQNGGLRHRTGGFFSVVNAQARFGGRVTLRQPLIHQPEIGILGFLAQHREGGMDLLVQAKPEPGNVGLVQLAPSVQATRSNYLRLHQGKPTPWLECFATEATGSVRNDTLQSEQGSRFLGKYNRNMLVELPPDRELDLGEGYRWASVSEVCALLATDFQVNTDARSVLMAADWSLLAGPSGPFGRWLGSGGVGQSLLRSYLAVPGSERMSDAAILLRLATLRAQFRFEVTEVPLDDPGWLSGQTWRLASPSGGFDIRHVVVSSSEREVQTWDQPLVAQAAEGRCILLAQEFEGVLHLLFRARPEIGFREGFQYGPVIQDLGGEGSPIPELDAQDESLLAMCARGIPLLSNLHSDEGGRFAKCVTRYSILKLEPQEKVPPSPTLSWMALAQVERLVKHRGVFSNEARTLVSMLLSML